MAYINPPDMSKEMFLQTHGERLNGPPKTFEKDGNLAICLVNNGMFTAAGICYCQQELETFSEPSDARPKIWFWVKKDLLEVYL